MAVAGGRCSKRLFVGAGTGSADVLPRRLDEENSRAVGFNLRQYVMRGLLDIHALNADLQISPRV